MKIYTISRHKKCNKYTILPLIPEKYTSFDFVVVEAEKLCVKRLDGEKFTTSNTATCVV